jgi:DNA-binding IclR family transcriptional regulator
MRNKVQTVDRALRILETFQSEGEELGVSELAARIGVHRSTASRVVATLAARGFLERAPGSEAFRLGPQLGRLGMLAVGGRDLIDLARRPMEKLSARTLETVTLAIRDGEEAATVAQVDAHYVVGVKNWIGRRTPLHCTSDGKVLLAFADGVANGSLPKVTARTITSKKELRRQLAQIRREGWAFAIGEYEDGLHGVAVPVFDASRRCLAALSVSGPSYRVPPDALPQLAERCQDTAQEIGEYLVWQRNGA